MIASALGEAGYNVYGYTFEATAYIEDYAAPDCPYIHNYLCSDDIVTYLPPWNMTRCGDVFALNTEESNAHLKEELDKLGSVMAESADAYLGFPGEDTCRKIMDVLTASIPTREAYSAVNIDTFPYGDGSMDIEYVYQDLFIKLAGIIFGGGTTSTRYVENVVVCRDDSSQKSTCDDRSQKSTNDDIGKKVRTTAVKTGDENEPLLWLLLCAAGLILLTALGWRTVYPGKRR